MKLLIPNLFEEICKAQNQPCSRYSSDLTISEDEHKVYIDAPIPGVNSEDIEVTLDQESRLLNISGKSKALRENAFYHLKGSDRYCYQIPLSAAVNVNEPIEASCKKGILTVALNKNKAPSPIKIEVKVA